jgi:hypothetical protein
MEASEWEARSARNSGAEPGRGEAAPREGESCQKVGWREVLGRRRFWGLNLVWIPHALFILSLILRYTVNLPAVDQWEHEVNFLKAYSEHGFRFSELVVQQAEHRQAMNNVVALINATLFQWDAQIQCVFLWLFVCSLGVALVFLSVTGSETRRWVQVIQMTLSGALLFGVSQYASWNNSSSTSWFTVECCLLAAMVLTRFRMGYGIRLAINMILAAVSTFSASTGMLMWGLFVPFLWIARPTESATVIRAGGVWVLGAVLCVGRYFWDYQKPPGGPSLSEGLEHPLQLIQFFLANLGCPFAKGTTAAPEVQGAWVGGVVVLIVIACLIYVLRNRRDRVFIEEALPWVILGGFCVGMGAAISVGRFSSGFAQATESRFVNTQVLLGISLIFLLPLVFRHGLRACEGPFEGSGTGSSGNGRPALKDNLSIWGAAGFGALSCGIFLLHLIQSVGTFDRQPHYRRIFLGSKAAVQFLRHFRDEQALRWTWTRSWEEFIPKVEFAASKGYLQLAPSTRIRELLASDSPSSSESSSPFGSMEQAAQAAPNVIALSGWAIDPDTHFPADAVLLSWETSTSEPQVFGVAQPANFREDLVTKTGEPEYRWAGWVRYLDTRGFPKAEVTVRAWAYNTRSLKVRALSGQFSYKPE